MALEKQAARVHSIQVSVDPDSGEVMGLSVSYDEHYTDAENPANSVTGMRTRDIIQPIREQAVADETKEASSREGQPDPKISDVARRMRDALGKVPSYQTASAMVAAIVAEIN